MKIRTAKIPLVEPKSYSNTLEIRMAREPSKIYNSESTQISKRPGALTISAMANIPPESTMRN